ncbi:MAG: ferredoxin family protein [Verrucomicrobiales bacterium]
MKNETTPFQVIFYEGEGASSIASDTRFSATSTLLDKGYAVTRVTEKNGNTLTQPSPHVPMMVLGDFAGSAPQLEDAAGKTPIESRDISGLDADAIVALLEGARGEKTLDLNQPGEAGMWKPWFPVIDYDRCTNCMQCLSFCLFDVYGVDEEKQIQVQNNDNCKTNCPACSRVCPEVAIMFPKYGQGPINGDIVSETDAGREKMKVDISSLLGGDIYSSLKTRSEKAKSRFSKERSPDKALTERKKCLTKLQKDGFIPAEVLAEIDLASLPSPEEIKRKSEELARLQAED